MLGFDSHLPEVPGLHFATACMQEKAPSSLISRCFLSTVK